MAVLLLECLTVEYAHVAFYEHVYCIMLKSNKFHPNNI